MAGVLMAIVVTPSFTSPAVINQPQTDSVTASGGTAPYAYAITSGALPIGLSLNGATGAITGIPNTAGIYTVTITAQDSLLAQGHVTFTIVITGAPTKPAAISSWLPKTIAEPCLLGGRRFLTARFDPGHLSGWVGGTDGTPFFPNAIPDAYFLLTQWNLADSIQGQRSIETYESLVISFGAGLSSIAPQTADIAVMIDPGNSLPIFFGGQNGPSMNFYACVPFNSNSNLIRVAFQISQGAFSLLPTDVGVLNLAVANWKIKPFCSFTLAEESN